MSTANTIGIDVHPYYQRGADWARIARDTQVRWAYVKASDGAAAYTKTVGGVTYRPDTHVAGARAAGLPVGVYHYGQPGDPVAQAKILIAQHQRLGATLPPMLDLEAPFKPDATARNFAQAFLSRMRSANFRPVLYLGASDARILRPDTWGIPDLIIWVASYGPNNGLQNAVTGGYPGRVDIHQYTSVGRVNGIAFNTDLNRSYINLTEDTVPLNQEIFEFRTPDGQLLRVDVLTAIGNLYAERFYGSSTAPWTGPSGRAIDQGELAEVPGVVTIDPAFAKLVADELVKAGVGQGVTADQMAAAFNAAATKLIPPPAGDA